MLLLLSGRKYKLYCCSEREKIKRWKAWLVFCCGIWFFVLIHAHCLPSLWSICIKPDLVLWKNWDTYPKSSSTQSGACLILSCLQLPHRRVQRQSQTLLRGVAVGWEAADTDWNVGNCHEIQETFCHYRYRQTPELVAQRGCGSPSLEMVKLSKMMDRLASGSPFHLELLYHLRTALLCQWLPLVSHISQASKISFCFQIHLPMPYFFFFFYIFNLLKHRIPM